MEIVINGQNQSIRACTLAELVATQGLDHRALVVEVNGRIIKEVQWSSLFLQEGDHLELLSFVGGG